MPIECLKALLYKEKVKNSINHYIRSKAFSFYKATSSIDSIIKYIKSYLYSISMQPSYIGAIIEINDDTEYTKTMIVENEGDCPSIFNIGYIPKIKDGGAYIKVYIEFQYRKINRVGFSILIKMSQVDVKLSKMNEMIAERIPELDIS